MAEGGRWNSADRGRGGRGHRGGRGRYHGGTRHSDYRSRLKETEETSTSSDYKRRSDSQVGSYKGGPKPPKKWTLSYHKVQELMRTSSPSEIILFLNSSNNGFKELLDKTNSTKGKNALLWSVIAKCCECDLKETLKEFLSTVNENKSFTVINLQTLLLEVQHGRDEPDDIYILENVSTFLEALSMLPSSVGLSTITLVLPILKETAESKEHVFGKPILERIEKLYDSKNRLRDNFRTQADVLIPTDEANCFRNISIFPDGKDFSHSVDPFLRPNVVVGRYQSVEHYLDTHFRLLREDFIRPLREGIESYQSSLEQKNKGEKPKKQDIPRDIRVYQDVSIYESTITEEGILHTVQLQVTDSFKRINWQTSKRLIFGSLLCFTCNGFENMFFGTVAERKEEKVKNGQILVYFEQPDMIEVGKNDAKLYTMIETSTYFEAYRHVLTVLQDISADTFPLKDYVVFLKNEIRPPTYAEDEKTGYCFGDCNKTVRFKSLLDSLMSDRTDDVENLALNLQVDNDDDSELLVRPCLGKKIHIHQEPDWNDLDLGLDSSQMKALKCALTQSISVIQGPPGTGKTFIGLKIVDILMHNQRIWTPESDQSPILIVCYTNHALDQFLQGILKTTSSIVRIGGRSKSDALFRYNLNAKRQFTSRNMFTMKNEIRQEIRIITKEICNLKGKLDASRYKLLLVKDLLNFIEERNLQSLINHRPSYLQPCTNPDFLLNVWLGLKEPDLSTWGEILTTEAPEYAYEGISFAESDYDDDNEDFDLYGQYSEQTASNTTANATNAPEFEAGTLNASQEENGDEMNDKPDAFVPEDVSEMKDEVDVEFLTDQRMIEGDSINALHTLDIPDDQEWTSKEFQNSVTTFSDCFNCPPMTKEHVRQCQNVWFLSLVNRWKLYRHWIIQFQDKCEADITAQRHEYKKQFSLLSECKQQIDRTTIRDSKVVGCTTTGAAKYNYLIRGIKSKIVIVEEAAEVLEAHVITALTENTQHLILIGDHKQLRPNPTVYELAKKFNLEISLFERLIKNNFPYCTLENQHRMKPCMSRLLVPDIYDKLIDHPSVQEYEEIKGMEKSMFFVTHTEKEFHSREDTSRVNIHEVDFLFYLCRYLLIQGYRPSQITILTTYLAQFFTIKRRMTGSLQDVRVSVLDNFQGEENDIILLSFVRSNEDEVIGFLKEGNRVCVSLSRAKKGLYCIGNFKLFASKSSLWRSIYEKLEGQDAIGPILKLKCQLHNNLVHVKTATDFINVSDGGCTENCDFRLECGHVCPKKCHPDDVDHLNFKCKKKCEKVNCEREHRCPKLCWEDCGDCIVLVNKIIPDCSHEIKFPCYKNPRAVDCVESCPKNLECTHKCPGLCGRPCSSYPCFVKVTAISSCGHEVEVECRYSMIPSKVIEFCRKSCTKPLKCGHKCTRRCRDKCIAYCNVVVQHACWCQNLTSLPCHQEQEISSQWVFSMPYRIIYTTKSRLESGCDKPCGKELQCGHLCLGTCGSCHQGRIHVPCKEPCGKTLVCGHQCTSPCASNCPPCRKQCENRCVHSRCRSPCGYPCTPCMERCAWKCPHKRCTRLCSEPCNRTPCERPCQKRLRCGHLCIGMCGDPCPRKCRICDAKEVSTIFFGDEDDPLARFVQLEDCGHIFEIRGISHWVEEQANDDVIHPILCPQCRTPIRRNLRFSAAVKSSLVKIERVKEKTFGIRNKSFNERKKLLLEVKLETFPSRHDEKYSSDPKSILKFISNQLSSLKKSLEPGTLTLFENYLTYAKENRRLVSRLSKVHSTADPKMSDSLAKICNFTGRTLWIINQVILKNMQQGSDQLMDDITREFRRLASLVNFVTEFERGFKTTREDVIEKVSEILALLLSHSPFLQDNESKVSELQKELPKLDGMAMLGITEAERLKIVKAIGLKQGHWYQCPNGHVYCIADCGGAVMESRCNECGATIGGGGHRLRSDNRVATEMDGATHSAWSEQRNMGNYELPQN